MCIAHRIEPSQASSKTWVCGKTFCYSILLFLSQFMASRIVSTILLLLSCMKKKYNYTFISHHSLCTKFSFPFWSFILTCTYFHGISTNILWFRCRLTDGNTANERTKKNSVWHMHASKWIYRRIRRLKSVFTKSSPVNDEKNYIQKLISKFIHLRRRNVSAVATLI